MPSLVAVDAEPGPAFVAALQRTWDRGDAVAPVDPRLPAPARAAVLAALRPGQAVDDGDALVVVTSGTTGAPKAVVLTHDAVAAHARAASARLAVDPAADRWLACLPLAHLGGLGVVVRAVLTGTPVTFDPADPTSLVSLVPTQLDRVDLDRFRAVLVGGSADWAVRPAHVVHTYGLTETGGGVVYDGVPLDGTEVRADDDGQLLVRGPTLLRAYRDGTSPVGPDRWLPTGDMGAVGEDGRVTVHGRRTEMIVTGGEKVWPARLEPLLRAHPSVADAIVTGRPDREWGERVVALVVPADPSSPPTLDALRGWVKERLPPWYAPRELELVVALDRAPTGKLRRR